MSQRKIVQISTACHAGSDQTSPYYGTVALCDDGTVWDGMFDGGRFVWKQLPPIPQDTRPTTPTRGSDE